MSSITLFDNKNLTDMNNKMVAHLWANEQQESASGSNFFLRGQVYIPMADILKLGVLLEMNMARKLI